MDYKEKYEQALERARMINNGEDVDVEAGTTTCEYIFPELKENEDEKIRKTIIRFFKDQYSNEIEMYDGSVTVGKAIAWLEKQGEQEPIEWKDSDEKYLFWALLSIQKDIAASEINGVNTKDLNDCVKWLYSLKQRIKGE